MQSLYGFQNLVNMKNEVQVRPRDKGQTNRNNGLG